MSAIDGLEQQPDLESAPTESADDSGNPSGDDLAAVETGFEPPVPTAEADDLPNFDPDAGTVVAGDPGAETEHWHQQEETDTCAVAAQEFVLESLTDKDFEESELSAEAAQNGWYTPGGGTPVAHVDSLLEAHGIPTETSFNGTTDQIAQELNEGNKVLVPVDAEEIWSSGADPILDDVANDPIPGQGADHVVEVTGLVQTQEGLMVVINDSGSPDGAGTMVPISEFESAWADSGSYMVSAGPIADDSVDAFPDLSMNAFAPRVSTV